MKYVGKLEKVVLIRVNLVTLRQVHHFPTSQPPLYLFNNTVLNMAL